MPSHKAYDTPTNAAAEDGEVTLDGPDGIGLSMTPAAAEETGRRLINEAKRARQTRAASQVQN
jgi:hypothetical protein